MGQCMASMKGEEQQPPQQQAQQQPQKQQHQQPAKQNNQQQPTKNNQQAPPAGQAPAFNGPRSFPASSAAGDPMRFQAGEHAKRRGDLMAQSQSSWAAGDKAAAKKFSEEGKQEGVLMDQCNAAAADAYFNDNNRGKGVGEIDLHGLHVQEAIDRVEARLKKCEADNLPQLIVIVGRGNHSKDGVQKIKPAMEKLIREHKLRVAVGAPNEGCLTIQFGEGDAGFVTNKGSANSADSAGCNQM